MTFSKDDKRKLLETPFEERMAKIFKEANLFFDQDSTGEGTNDPPENEIFAQKEMIDGNGAKCKACEDLESKFSSVIERLEKQNKVIENLRKENTKMALDFESQIKVKKETFNESLQKNKTDFDLQLSNVVEERDYLIEENKFNDNSIKNLMEKYQKLDELKIELNLRLQETRTELEAVKEEKSKLEEEKSKLEDENSKLKDLTYFYIGRKDSQPTEEKVSRESTKKKSSKEVKSSEELNNELDQQLNKMYKKQSDGTFSCNSCGKISMRKFNAREHAELHVEGLIFNCNQCGSSFSTRHNLRSHKYKKKHNIC